MLKIVDLKGQHLANLHQEPGAGLMLEVIDEQLRPELEAFLEAVRTEPVYLVSGTHKIEGQRNTHQTVRKLVRPGEVDFLKGVQDLIARQKVQIGDRRVRGLLVEP